MNHIDIFQNEHQSHIQAVARIYVYIYSTSFKKTIK